MNFCVLLKGFNQSIQILSQNIINLNVKFKYIHNNVFNLEACRIFIKLSFLLKYVSQECDDPYKPFLSYPTSPNEERLYPYEIALEACKIILSEENIDPSCVYEFTNVFEQAVVDDIS